MKKRKGSFDLLASLIEIIIAVKLSIVLDKNRHNKVTILLEN